MRSRVPLNRTRVFAANVKLRKAPIVSMLAHSQGSAMKGSWRSRNPAAATAIPLATIRSTVRVWCAGAFGMRWLGTRSARAGRTLIAQPTSILAHKPALYLRIDQTVTGEGVRSGRLSYSSNIIDEIPNMLIDFYLTDTGHSAETDAILDNPK